MSGLLHDIRYAIRQLRNSPGFTAVAIITLALGVGANTAIFSLINAIMLRTLPVKDPQSLVLLKWKAHRIPATIASLAYDNCTHGEGSWNGQALISQTPPEPEGCSFSFPLYQAIQAKSAVFSSVAAFAPEPGNLTVNSSGRTSQARALFVSGNFFSVLGAHPALGRLIAPSDDSAAAAPAIVVSYRFWRNELSQDRSIVGKHVLLGKTLFTVAGVAGPEFPELDPGLPSDIWVPLSFQPMVEPRFPKMTAVNALWIELMARLRPGVSAAQAASAATAAFAATASGPDAMFKPDDAPQVELSSAARGLATLRQNFSQPLFALLAGVGIILLISCANIAGLMLARSAARQKELAMRVALGATRVRILRQLLTESLLLSLIGGAAGTLLGYLGSGALARFLAHNWYLPMQVDVHPDAHVLIFTLLVSILAGIAFGLAPMFSSGRLELVPALKESAESASAGGRRITLGNSLVVIQMALAVLVCAGTGLLVHTLYNLKAENIGFDPENIVVFRLDATYSNRTGGNLGAFYRDLEDQLSSLPGVSSASRSGVLLLSGGGMGGTIFSRDQSGSPIHVDLLPVSGNFFKTMGIPLLAGRSLNVQDSNAPSSNTHRTHVVVNEALARRLFGTLNPVARHFRVDEDGPENEIVGVVADAKYANLRDDMPPTIYTSIAGWDGDMYFEVRSGLDPTAMMPAIRSAVSRFDPNLLITDMKTEEEQIDQNIYQERLIANLSSLFALLALIVACVGIYGLLTYQVTRRTQEIGIRLALGAQRGDVLRIVLRQGTVLAVLGTVLGAAAALVLTRYLQSFLYGVKPSDPLTMICVAFLLIAVALLASYIPARRAAKVDPMEALRYE